MNRNTQSLNQAYPPVLFTLQFKTTLYYLTSYFVHICYRITSAVRSMNSFTTRKNLLITINEKILTNIFFFSDCVMSKVQLPPCPQKYIKVKQMCANSFWHIIYTIEHFQSLYRLFSGTVCISCLRCATTSGDGNIFCQF